jgi:hypothetical protein
VKLVGYVRGHKHGDHPSFDGPDLSMSGSRPMNATRQYKLDLKSQNLEMDLRRTVADVIQRKKCTF